MSHHGVGPRAVMRSVAFLTAGVLAVPLLAGCSSEDEAGRPLVGQDIAPAGRSLIADGGTLRWAVDALPETLNTFQADADAATTRVAQATLPSMFRLDERGRPQRNPDYLESAKVVGTEPKQVVLYKLNQQAVWSDGREIGAADFAAQWRALSGKDSAYWTARNAGYDRIEKIERGANDLEVKVTFARPYADWQSLFSPLYPKDVMGTPDSFNDGARRKLKITAGPFAVRRVDRTDDEVTLVRNPRWWGRPAKLSEIVLRAVPRDKRSAALAAGQIDLAEIEPSEARRISLAAPPRPKGTRSGSATGAATGAATGSATSSASGSATGTQLMGPERRRKDALQGYEVRKSLEPAYTQLALNGAEGPLSDERVRRAVARALDRDALAKAVLTPLGLPAEPVGSHLALSGQAAYSDNSGALGDQDTAEAQALLADAGWVLGGPVKAEEKEKGEKAAGAEGKKDGKADVASGKAGKGGKGDKAGKGQGGGGSESAGGDDGTYIVGEENKGRRHDGPAFGGPAFDGPAMDGAHRGGPAMDGPGMDGHGAGSRGMDGRGMSGSGGDGSRDDKAHREAEREKTSSEGGKESRSDGEGARHLAHDGKLYANQHLKQGGVPGAYAPRGTAAPAGAAAKVLAKKGKALTLRFVLPSGAGSEALHTVAGRISRMLERVGIRTEITKVADQSYFKDHIASGQYDLALYSWPASAFPATDARPIYAKPVPAADGSLNVEQNYTRVGTDQVDQLFDQAVATLDEGESRALIRKADSRIWAAAASIPLYQRPQLTAARKTLVNAGAFGFQTPVYEDMGFLKKGASPSPSASRS